MRRACAALPLALTACGTVAYAPADLQLDVAAPVPDAAETLRVCVTGRGVHSQGIGNGRAVVTGLPAGAPAEVRLEILDDAGVRIAEAGPVTLDAATPWASIPLLPAADGCDDPGAPAPADADTALLAVRFEEWIQ
jgi:hypothetical protein